MTTTPTTVQGSEIRNFRSQQPKREVDDCHEAVGQGRSQELVGGRKEGGEKKKPDNKGPGGANQDEVTQGLKER